ncbi:MAG: hypothetical protein K5Q00_00270, partial [Gammaproteobacteria bacterium]|nr:hypothetical protein [Gammaproteobacteria bacterium]
MLNQDTFQKVKSTCISLLSKSGAYSAQTVNSAHDIAELLQALLDELPKGPDDFLTQIHSKLFGNIANKKQTVLIALQKVCDFLIINHLESLMIDNNTELSDQRTTLLDWNRNYGCDWQVNDHLFHQAGSIMQYRSYLQMYGITDRNLITLIATCANQTCWLEPIAIVKRAYLMRGDMLSDELGSLPAPVEEGLSNWVYQRFTNAIQHISPFNSPTKNSPAENHHSTDSVHIIQLGAQGLQVKLIKHFPKLILATNQQETLLNPAIKVTIQFEVYLLPRNNYRAIVRNFSMNVENLHAELMSPTIAIAYYFLNQPQRSQTPPLSSFPASPFSSPSKHYPTFGSPARPIGSRPVSRPPSSQGVRQHLALPGGSPTRAISRVSQYETAPSSPRGDHSMSTSP